MGFSILAVRWMIVTQLCHNLSLEYFHHSERKPILISSQLPIQTNPQPKTTTNLFGSLQIEDIFVIIYFYLLYLFIFYQVAEDQFFCVGELSETSKIFQDLQE